MTLTNKRTGEEIEMKSFGVEFGTLGTLPAVPKEFSSGSIGYYASGKVVDDEGRSYQVTCSIVLTHSKPE
jgi:hypothetical protein